MMLDHHDRGLVRIIRKRPGADKSVDIVAEGELRSQARQNKDNPFHLLRSPLITAKLLPPLPRDLKVLVLKQVCPPVPFEIPVERLRIEVIKDLRRSNGNIQTRASKEEDVLVDLSVIPSHNDSAFVHLRPNAKADQLFLISAPDKLQVSVPFDPDILILVRKAMVGACSDRNRGIFRTNLDPAVPFPRETDLHAFSPDFSHASAGRWNLSKNFPRGPFELNVRNLSSSRRRQPVALHEIELQLPLGDSEEIDLTPPDSPAAHILDVQRNCFLLLVHADCHDLIGWQPHAQDALVVFKCRPASLVIFGREVLDLAPGTSPVRRPRKFAPASSVRLPDIDIRRRHALERHPTVVDWKYAPHGHIGHRLARVVVDHNDLHPRQRAEGDLKDNSDENRNHRFHRTPFSP